MFLGYFVFPLDFEALGWCNVLVEFLHRIVPLAAGRKRLENMFGKSTSDQKTKLYSTPKEAECLALF